MYGILFIFLYVPNTVVALSSTTTNTASSNVKNEKRVKPIPWIACASAIEVQRACKMYIQPGDKVLELGSQLSKVSETICRAVGDTGCAVLMDVERKEASSGRSKDRDLPKYEYYRRSFHDDWRADSKKIKFIELKEVNDWTQSLWSTELDFSSASYSPIFFDVLVIDLATMTGNDLLLKTVSTVQTFVDHHKRTHGNPKCVIIKSTSMTNLSRRLHHAQRVSDGTTILPSPELQERSHDPLIIATVGVNEYRQMIPYTVKGSDEVIEVGCHVGTTTKRLHDIASESSGFCIGVDNGSKIIDLAKKSYGDSIPFFVGDAWRTGQLNHFKTDQLMKTLNYSSSSFGYDVIFVDIGGLSGPDGLLESLSLIQSMGMACEPRSIVIKSLCMRRLASSLRPFCDIWQHLHVSNTS